MFKNNEELINKIKNYIPREHHNALWLLWLDKYSYDWRYSKDKNLQKELPARKTSALIFTANLAKPEKLAEACKNKLAFIERLRNFHGDRLRVVELVNDSKLMLHLARSNVLENVGLYAERITGLPIIPGTSLKGALSTLAFWEAFDKHGILYEDKAGKEKNHFKERKKLDNLAERIFGDNSENGSQGSGNIVFVGGFPALPPELGIDIVNPHYDEKGNDKEKLTPNTFLCVEPGTIWKFVFFARPGANDYKQLLDQTERWLKDCLTQTGIGAKTAAGYGRFREVEDEDRRNLEKFWKNIEKPKVPPTGTAPGPKPHSPPQPPTPLPDLTGDYPNEQFFKNLIIKNLESSSFEALKKEIEKLKKPENSKWLQKLKEYLAKDKEMRKKLKEKDWFPKEWIQ
ncbi:MAG: type III-B CRISPR module RAMP protein Cmr6 [Limisphaerales bacterium]